MKVGVFTVILRSMPLEQALDYLAGLGVETVEIGTGAFTGVEHCDADALLASDQKAKDFLKAISSRGLQISCLSVHGNPIHPDRDVARDHDAVFKKTVRLAEKLEVPVVITFSGCPGDSDKAKYPNWVTCPWPPDFQELLTWQWEKKVVPYWSKTAAFAKDHGVKVALEAHPGFVVYNTETALKLRKAAGDTIGVNFDPSHLFWMGADPLAAIRTLGPAIYHVHAKDTRIDPAMASVNSVIDTKAADRLSERSWSYVTLGYGHDVLWWRQFCSALRLAGYDDVLSIEHEDLLLPPVDGVRKSVELLRGAI